LAGGVLAAGAAIAKTEGKPRPIEFPAFQRVVDLTHLYTEDFPDYVNGKARLKREVLASRKEGKLANAYRWSFDEHCATRMDAPVHSSEGKTVDEVPAADLVCPLAVINIAARAEQDADAQLTLEDVRRWEGKHGPIAAGRAWRCTADGSDT
jgi:kynurenine formamidase